MNGPSERSDEQRLAKARDPLDQCVAAGEETGEDLGEGVFMTDDDSRDLLAEFLGIPAEALDLGRQALAPAHG